MKWHTNMILGSFLCITAVASTLTGCGTVESQSVHVRQTVPRKTGSVLGWNKPILPTNRYYLPVSIGSHTRYLQVEFKIKGTQLPGLWYGHKLTDQGIDLPEHAYSGFLKNNRVIEDLPIGVVFETLVYGANLFVNGANLFAYIPPLRIHPEHGKGYIWMLVLNYSPGIGVVMTGGSFRSRSLMEWNLGNSIGARESKVYVNRARTEGWRVIYASKPVHNH